MFKKIAKFLIFGIGFFFLVSFAAGNTSSSTNSASNTKENCVKLNTPIPGIGDKICIGEDQNTDEKKGETHVTAESAFPTLMGALMKIVVSLIIAVGLVMIVAGGLLITASGADQSRYGKGKDMIIKVAIGIALLGLSGVILHMINPNFFK